MTPNRLTTKSLRPGYQTPLLPPSSQRKQSFVRALPPIAQSSPVRGWESCSYAEYGCPELCEGSSRLIDQTATVSRLTKSHRNGAPEVAATYLRPGYLRHLITELLVCFECAEDPWNTVLSRYCWRERIANRRRFPPGVRHPPSDSQQRATRQTCRVQAETVRKNTNSATPVRLRDPGPSEAHL